MIREPSQTFVHDLDTLYQVGTLGSLGDRELLEYFVTRGGTVAQRAFEAILHRHGSMVLGVCRRVLYDEQAAEDAFQATFLVLALKAGTIRKHELLGPWLQGVAFRISRRAKVSAYRRHEQPLLAEPLIASMPGENEADTVELRAVLDEEIGRLPAVYRKAVVLCYLEGKTQEDAARELGWTKGTVSGRLARAKDLLRARLIRRGIAPSSGLLGTLLAHENASAAVSAPLTNATVRAALGVVLGRTETFAVSGSVAALAEGAMRAMLLGKIKLATGAVLMLAALASALAYSNAGPARHGQERRGENRKPASSRPVTRVRNPEWPDPKLPKHARARLGTTHLRHEGQVSSVAFAPDGRTLASTGWDGTVRFWNVATGALATSLATIKEAEGAAGAVYSPDGTKLAIGRDSGMVQLWDLTAGKELLSFPRSQGACARDRVRPRWPAVCHGEQRRPSCPHLGRDHGRTAAHPGIPPRVDLPRPPGFLT